MCARLNGGGGRFPVSVQLGRPGPYANLLDAAESLGPKLFVNVVAAEIIPRAGDWACAFLGRQHRVVARSHPPRLRHTIGRADKGLEKRLSTSKFAWLHGQLSHQIQPFLQSLHSRLLTSWPTTLSGASTHPVAQSIRFPPVLERRLFGTQDQALDSVSRASLLLKFNDRFQVAGSRVSKQDRC